MGSTETSRIERSGLAELKAAFLASHRVVLIVLSGSGVGVEHELAQPDLICGRGPRVDLAFEDDAMSRAHVSLELGRDGYRLRDLGSTTGVRVNGSEVQLADLKDGDRIEMGAHVLQYVIEKRSKEPRTYYLPDD
jgi:pSer/pThr/pTyr-binding forkhead associated (FHA) protein